MTAAERKQAKYQEDLDGFKVEGIVDGPKRDRKVTDFGCLILFIVFLITMVACTIYGFRKGDVSKFIASIDRNDNFCGISEGFTEYPKLYLTSLVGSPSDIFDSGVCIKDCPHASTDTISCADNTADQDLCSSNDVSSKIYDTHTVMGYCMPDLTKLKEDRPDDYAAWKTAFNGLLTSNPAGRQVQDLYLSSRAIYWSMAMSLVYSLLYIALMSYFAEYIAWAIIAVTQIGLIGASVFCFVAPKMLDDDGASTS